MKPMLSELWDNYVLSGKRSIDEYESEMLERMDKYFNLLNEHLDEYNLKLLNEFIECYDQLLCCENRCAFIDGFIQGSKIMMEIK